MKYFFVHSSNDDEDDWESSTEAWESGNQKVSLKIRMMIN